jgi:hypothetical protein
VEVHFVVLLLLLYAVLHEAEVSQKAVSLALRVCGQAERKNVCSGGGAW